jgi:hypothetical protein
MARNGAGTYNLPSGNPVVTGSTISSTWANSTLNDIATALTGSISSDGQTTPTGNLPMGGYNHTNVADATVRTQYGSAGQIQDSAFTFLTSPSGTNAMTATAALGMSAYVTGQRFTFVAPSTNTSACTLNINAIGAKAITKSGSTALAAGDVQSGAIIQVIYDGTQFQMVSPTLTVSSFSGGSTGLTPSSATTGAVTLAGTLGVANGGTGATTLTANNVLLGNGTSAPQTVAPGTSGNVLTSNGSTWTSAAGVTGSLGSSGYTKLSNGLTLAWGSITTSNTGGSNNNYYVIGGSATLPVTFTAVYQATVSFGTGNVFYGASIGVSSLTTTTLTVSGSSPYGNGTPNVTYLVIGTS